MKSAAHALDFPEYGVMAQGNPGGRAVAAGLEASRPYPWPLGAAPHRGDEQADRAAPPVTRA